MERVKYYGYKPVMILSLIIFWGCTHRNTEDGVVEKFLLFLREQGHSLQVNGREVYMVITLEGCGGCIDTCLDFVANQYKNERLQIVLTQSSGKKGMKLRAGERLFSDVKVIKDYNNDLARYEVVNFEPVVFFFEDSELKKYTYLNTSNLVSAFEEIRLYLTPAN